MTAELILTPSRLLVGVTPMPEGLGPFVSSVTAEPRLQTGVVEGLLDVRANG